MAAAIFCAAILGLLNAPSASALIVNEPTILGPSGGVHEVGDAGYESNTVYWVDTQGLEKPEVNAALWETPLVEADYQVEVWIPKQQGYTYARYNVTHSAKTSEVRLRQSNFGNEWMVLGTYSFDGSTATVRSTDAAGYPGEQLAWDAMRWTPVAEIPPNVETQGDATTINEPQIAGPEGFVVRFVGVGYRGDLLRADARGAGESAVNTATWHVGLPVGEYTVEAFIPAEHAEAEVGYTVDDARGEKTVEIAQKSYNNLWVKLGNFSFGGTGATVTSTDATGTKGQEIAWDALRFTATSNSPPTEEKPAPGATGGETPIGTPTATATPPPPQPPQSVAPLVGPLVPVQNPRKLVRFSTYRLFAGGPEDAYAVGSLHASSKRLHLRYRCAPCLFMPVKFMLLAHSKTPVTRRSTEEGAARSLIGKPLYKGSAIEVTVSEAKHRSRHYGYRLEGGGRIKRSRGYVTTAGIPVRPCTG